MKIKRKKFTAGLIIGLLLSAFFLFNKNWLNQFNIAAVKADDENERDDGGSRVPIINTNPSNNTPKQAETKTIYEKLSDTVTKITETTTQFDSDGDGIFDEQDKNPTINDNYIVKDANLNGIDDQYEQRI